MKSLSLSATSATIEATQRGYIVWLRDASGRTIGEEYFQAQMDWRGNFGDVPRLSKAIKAAYSAAAAFADRINSRG